MSDTKTAPTGRDAGAKALLPVAEAKRHILDLVTPVATRERVGVRDALDRVLAEDIQSAVAVPSYDNSAMDGYAVLGADLPATGETELTLVGKSFAGVPYDGSVSPGQCVRIMTGAAMPAGADTVIMQEDVTTSGDGVRIRAGHRPGQNVRRAGEDIRAGSVVLRAGQHVGPAELGLLASVGIAELNVLRRIRVAFFSTGDELRGVGDKLEYGQIFDSNRYTLFGMLKRLGVELIDMGVIRDRREDVRRAFADAAAVADAIITSGGVSVGEADYVKETLETMGQVDFWRIAMKPGKPLAVGRIDQAYFFGLPGNPVSVMATFYQFVRPALEKLMGTQPSAPLILKLPCEVALRKQPGRLEYQRGVLQRGVDGTLSVATTGGQDSHLLTSMSRADCFIILPADNAGVAAGDLVDVQPFAGLV
jgi:molybdopterin molybdotransferase